MTVGSPGFLKMREFPWKSLNVTYYPRYNATLEYYIIYLEPMKSFGMPVSFSFTFPVGKSWFDVDQKKQIQGDSGGPMVRERSEDGRSVLWAVHSGTFWLIFSLFSSFSCWSRQDSVLNGQLIAGTLRLKAEFREKEELARSYAVNTGQIRSFVCKWGNLTVIEDNIEIFPNSVSWTRPETYPYLQIHDLFSHS